MIKLPATIQMGDASAVAGMLARSVSMAQNEIDCSDLVRFDSGALAALMHAKRAYAASGASDELKIKNVPDNLRRLAQLYGVESLLFPS